MRTARRLLRVLVLGSLIVGGPTVAVLAPDPAYAQPSISDIEHQIKTKSAALERVVEQYDKVTDQLKKTTAAAGDLRAQLVPLKSQLDQAYANVSQMATAAYMGGPLSQVTALLQAGSPGALINQLNSLDQVAQTRQTRIAAFEKTKADYEARQLKLTQALAAQSSQQHQLKDQKAKIKGELTTLYAMREQAYGTAQETSSSSGSHPSAPYVAGKAGIAVKFAYAQLGKPYEWAADGPGSYDCSGLTMAAWRQAGVSLPHNAAEQYHSVPHISRSQLKPGDLVFYEDLGHVAMYVGDNKVIHAPTFGEVVKISSVDMMSPYGFGRP